MKSVVLLSAGLDSTVNLYMALERKHQVAKVLTFNYGQKAAAKEIQRSQKICQLLNLSHQVIDLPFFSSIGRSSLISTDTEVPTKEVDIQSIETSKKSAQKVWVPNRNGIFLNIAAGFAESLDADCVIPGFNLEEAETFPDNSYEYLVALTNSFSYSTNNRVQVECFTHQMNKSEIVQEGLNLKIPFNLLWPCYFGHEKPCGQCESCQRTARAFKENKIDLSILF